MQFLFLIKVFPLFPKFTQIMQTYQWPMKSNIVNWYKFVSFLITYTTAHDNNSLNFIVLQNLQFPIKGPAEVNKNHKHLLLQNIGASAKYTSGLSIVYWTRIISLTFKHWTMEHMVFLFLLLTVCCAAQKISSNDATAKARVDRVQKSTDILIAKANQVIVDVNGQFSKKGKRFPQFPSSCYFQMVFQVFLILKSLN